MQRIFLILFFLIATAAFAQQPRFFISSDLGLGYNGMSNDGDSKLFGFIARTGIELNKKNSVGIEFYYSGFLLEFDFFAFHLSSQHYITEKFFVRPAVGLGKINDEDFSFSDETPADAKTNFELASFYIGLGYTLISETMNAYKNKDAYPMIKISPQVIFHFLDRDHIRLSPMFMVNAAIHF